MQRSEGETPKPRKKSQSRKLTVEKPPRHEVQYVQPNSKKLVDAPLIRNFVKLFLLSRYDNVLPSPPFHDDMWELCCSESRQVAIAAPRGTAKSTAITLAYVLAKVLFRDSQHVMIVSDTEGQAAQFLGDIASELRDNRAIVEEFQIENFSKNAETEIIVRFKDGYCFRIVAKGSEQKVRGTKWRHKRMDLVVCDDLENDEIVMNPERRLKFRNWFMNALLPSGSDFCEFRIVGTILHLDSMLQRLLDSKTWSTKVFRAHGPEFSDLLWPEKYTVERLKTIRDGYLEDGNIEGYSQEYLNNPVAEGQTYFRKQDFLPMSDDDRDSPKMYFAAADFAISESERADYTVMIVVGMDSAGIISVVDVRRGRWDADEIIKELLSIQKRYKPEVFTFETEKIDKAIGPSLNRNMQRTGLYININKIAPTKSKTTRGRSMQSIMRAGGVRFDEYADWYKGLLAELMTITPAGPKGKHDDMFDAFSYIGLTVDKYYEAGTTEEIEDWEYEEELEEYYEDEDVSICGY